MSAPLDPAALRSAWSAEGLSVPPIHVPEIGSTQDRAGAEAADGAPHGLVVLADRQTAGRGRRGRRWLHGEDGLAFSLVLRPDHAPAALGWVPLAVAVGLREAVMAHVGWAPGIKWPNDLWDPQGAKIAGILAEAEITAGRVAHVVVGVGLNVGAAPAIAGAGGVGARDRERLAARCVARILTAVARPTHAVRAAWEAGCAHGDRVVSVAGHTGTTLGLAEDGGLRLRRADGEEVVVHTGDVALVGDLPGPQPATIGTTVSEEAP